MSKPNASTPVQPKVNQKRMMRYAFGLMGIALCVAAYQALKTCGKDIDLPAYVNTEGFITAVQMDGRTSRVVVIEPDGTLRESPEGIEGGIEKDAVWRPDGNRVFFSANREEGGAFNLYRWNLGSDRVEARSKSGRNVSGLEFAPQSAPDANDRMLIVKAGADLIDYSIASGEGRVILSMLSDVSRGQAQAVSAGENKDTGESDVISESPLKAYGRSMVRAQWSPDEKSLFVLLARDEGGQSLIRVTLGNPAPEHIMSGRRIEFQMSPTQNRVYIAVQEFQWLSASSAPEEFVKDGKLTTPFRHALLMIDLDKTTADGISYIVATDDDSVAFSGLAVSYDGSMLAMVENDVSPEGDLKPRGLIVMPATADGVQAITRVMGGEIFEPSWGADNNTLAFIMREKGRRAIFTIKRDGTELTNVTGDRGDFSRPKLSPQVGK